MKHELTEWRKSSYSGASSGSTNDCVEVKAGQTIGVRDTKDRVGGQLTVPASTWSAFITTVKTDRD